MPSDLDPADLDTADLDSAKYVSFVSFRKDGTPVAAPVWLVPFEGGYAFTTDASSWKVKRVMRNPNVTLVVCNLRGKVRAGAIVHNGTAEVLDRVGTLAVREAVKAKYRIAYALLISWSDRRAARTAGSPAAASCAIKVTVTS